MLFFENVGFSYKLKKDEYEVYKDINLTVTDNEFLCILGPSGCGKSTLLKNVAGFTVPTVGRILDDGVKISGISYERAMVFQENAVFPWLTVRDNISYGLRVRKVDSDEIKKTVKECVELVGLEGYEDRLPKELSGGMLKRVDLARVLANNPKMILMDEPFGALDAFTKEMLQTKLTEIWEREQKTILFVTHDIEEALFLGDRILVLQHINNGGGFRTYDIDFPRPRSVSVKEDTNFQHMRRELIQEFKQYEEE